MAKPDPRVGLASLSPEAVSRVRQMVVLGASPDDVAQVIGKSRDECRRIIKEVVDSMADAGYIPAISRGQAGSRDAQAAMDLARIEKLTQGGDYAAMSAELQQRVARQAFRVMDMLDAITTVCSEPNFIMENPGAVAVLAELVLDRSSGFIASIGGVRGKGTDSNGGSVA